MCVDVWRSSALEEDIMTLAIGLKILVDNNEDIMTQSLHEDCRSEEF